jgi:dTDP-4-dehydrorhamnose 3,5-epimerase-like enzyme
MEAERSVPFPIRRVYALVDLAQGATRGAHAHRRLRQVVLALKGGCRVLLDDGRERVAVEMDRSSRGLLLEPMVWHEMTEFSSDCVLLVLAEQHYDEADYIRDRAEFLRLSEGAGR